MDEQPQTGEELAKKKGELIAAIDNKKGALGAHSLERRIAAVQDITDLLLALPVKEIVSSIPALSLKVICKTIHEGIKKNFATFGDPSETFTLIDVTLEISKGAAKKCISRAINKEYVQNSVHILTHAAELAELAAKRSAETQTKLGYYRQQKSILETILNSSFSVDNARENYGIHQSYVECRMNIYDSDSDHEISIEDLQTDLNHLQLATDYFSKLEIKYSAKNNFTYLKWNFLSYKNLVELANNHLTNLLENVDQESNLSSSFELLIESGFLALRFQELTTKLKTEQPTVPSDDIEKHAVFIRRQLDSTLELLLELVKHNAHIFSLEEIKSLVACSNKDSFTNDSNVVIRDSIQTALKLLAGSSEP